MRVPGTLVPALLICLLAAPEAGADASSEARTPGEVYERHRSLGDALLYVARDLAVRAKNRDTQALPQLVLVVDPTPSLVPELRLLADTVQAAFDEGPAGLRMGIVGVEAEETPPSGIPADARNGLLALAFLPVHGPKNLLAGVRRAAASLGPPRGAPRAVLLVTEEGGEGEDDVEKTREALLDADAAFYAIAPEAAFERSWLQTFKPRAVAGREERYHPAPARRAEAGLYYGSETALGLIPYRWELDLAQTEFKWVGRVRYPVPSGFGYWSLASLAFTTGGRYFLHDFTRRPRRAGAAVPRPDRRTLLYDYGRLGRLAPDLRPRERVLKDLSKDVRARTIVRIWQHLADEACPVIGTLGTLELVGGALRVRPARPVRSISRSATWYEDMTDVRKAIGFTRRRLDALAPTLKWWASADLKPRRPVGRLDPLDERIEADFKLLGVQLAKVHFHWMARLAALKRIKPLHVSHRRVRIRPIILATGFRRRPAAEALKDEALEASFGELWASMLEVRTRYPRTPWALVIEKGWIADFDLDVRIIEDPTAPAKPPVKGGGKSEPDPKPTKPPAPPPAGPRPGSATDAPATK